MKETLLKCTVREDSTIKDVIIKEFDISSRLLRKLKLNKQIFCNGKVAWVNGIARVGDEIVVNVASEGEAENIKSEEGIIDVLYELRCKAVHGEIELDKTSEEIYEHAFFMLECILRKLI